MKKIIVVFATFLTLISCNQKNKQEDLPKINGYWEIEKVLLPDGEKKEYKVNESIDYFELKDKKGFRKKVYPQLDGKYLINNVKENIVISDSSGIFFVNYTTAYSKWKEQIITLKDSILVLKNPDKLEYHYKRQTPFSLK